MLRIAHHDLAAPLGDYVLDKRRYSVKRLEMKLGVTPGNDEIARLDHPKQSDTDVGFQGQAGHLQSRVREGTPEQSWQIGYPRTPLLHHPLSMAKPIVGVLHAAKGDGFDSIEIADIQGSHASDHGSALSCQRGG